MPDPIVPVSATPVAIPVSTEAPNPSPEPAKVEAPAPALDTPVVKAEPVKPEAPTPPPEPPATSLLATAEAKKPEEAKPKPPEEPKVPAPVESAPITYEPFKLPEGFDVDEKDMGDFTATLGEFKAPQELGQKIIDLYTKELQKVAELQQANWQKTLDNWKNDVLADPELGGNRIHTVLEQCGSVLEQFGSPELRKMLEVSGMGNNIEMVRFVHKVAKFIGEPKPVLGHNPVPDKKPSRADRRYSRSNGAQA